MYITTERDPWNFYTDAVGNKNQLIRRVDVVLEYSGSTVTVMKNTFIEFDVNKFSTNATFSSD